MSVKVKLSIVGFEKHFPDDGSTGGDIKVFVAHAPDWNLLNPQEYLNHEMKREGDSLVCDLEDVSSGTEIKCIVVGLSEDEAKEIHQARTEKGVARTTRFDYDSRAGHMNYWPLPDDLEIVRPNEWNQNCLIP